ncbi:MAG TPA: PEP-CTERM sorting domain-containing protein [Bryobacteraceae bacterium]|nr:PEP-CTERM sorting domain-containing protein [Bryobacteraceae bacterium]
MKIADCSTVRRGTLPALAGFLMMWLVPAGFGDVLPASGTEESIDMFGGRTLFSSNSPGCESFDGAMACAALGSDPSVSASDTNTNLGAGAEVAFYFEVLGAPGVSVPLDISGVATGSGGSYTGRIDVGLYTVPDSFTTVLQYAYPTLAPGPFEVHTSTVSDFISQMDVEAGCALPASSTAPCETLIDPTIQIDPSFSGASQFTLIESTESLSIVPEPALLPLLAVGLCAVLILRRRVDRDS